jgi:hypothetical protein
VRTLSSGKQIKVMSLQQTTQANLGATLVLDYVTTLKIEDRENLKREVEEIWADVRKDADQAKVDAVFIVANEAPVGRSTSFTFRRNTDGTWRQSGGFGSKAEGPSAQP